MEGLHSRPLKVGFSAARNTRSYPRGLNWWRLGKVSFPPPDQPLAKEEPGGVHRWPGSFRWAETARPRGTGRAELDGSAELGTLAD